MDRINSINQVVELIRQRLGSSPSTRNPNRSTNTSRRETPHWLTSEQVQHRIVERLRQLPPNEPKYRDTARKIFVEVVLSTELGDTLLLDTRFMEVIEQVQATISSNPELSASLDKVLDEISTVR